MKSVLTILLAILLFTGGCAHVQKDTSSTASDGALQLVMTSTGYSWVAMRYNEVTGEAWFHFPYYWRTIGEKEELAESNYNIRMVGFGGNQWMAIRLDTSTGRCWKIEDSCWIEIGKNITLDPYSGTFNLEMISFATGWEAILYNVNTGEAWLHFADLWRSIDDNEKPDNSIYTVKMEGGEGWLAIRMDIRSGRCWMIEEKKDFFHWSDMEMDVKP